MIGRMAGRHTALAAFAVAGLVVAGAGSGTAHAACGEVVTLDTHSGTTAKYSLAGVSSEATFALVLLPGGGGYLKLDDAGCPRKLKGNSLVRSRKLFHAAGFVTALVDAPDDRHGRAGLGGFRVKSGHAKDIGKVIADIRRRTKLPVWLIGTSRGAISASNAAARLTGAAAPDGLVVTSPVTSGKEGGRKPWVAQTVFSNDLEKIRMPVLVVVHAEDTCIRTPPDLGRDIIEKIESAREQVVSVTGGPGWDGGSNVKSCKGRSPHGFIGQEAEVAAGIARFIRGGKY
jgi:hypothetical protein